MASKCQHSLPDQDIDEIRECVLTQADSVGHVEDENLFIDPYFPPDQSILNFVYSGDDKYEKMVFKRPRELCVSPNLCGVGGVCQIKLPWKQWNDRSWFIYGLATVSLNPAYMKKILPGHVTFEQTFTKNYCGAFNIYLWRFGEWIEVVVDDNLPVLDGIPAYCPLFSTPPEAWGALVEKAYAKCHRVYEAIEVGNPINALVDLTGSICEHFITDRNNSRLFHILYKSYLNRSLQVCWRHQRSLKEPGFISSDSSHNNHNADKADVEPNQLFILTAVSKFPMRDGSLLEIVRLKDPYNRQCKQWRGDFSQGHASWNRVNPSFIENYRPQECREPSEFWISFAVFCVHFGDVVVCSDVTPYDGLETDCERRYKGGATDDFTALDAVPTFPTFDGSVPSPPRPNSAPDDKTRRFTTSSLTASLKRRTKKGEVSKIIVKESRSTIKVDTVSDMLGPENNQEPVTPRNQKHRGSKAKYIAPIDDDLDSHICKVGDQLEMTYYQSVQESNQVCLSSATQRARRRRDSTSSSSMSFTGIFVTERDSKSIAVDGQTTSVNPALSRLSGASSSGTDSTNGSNACMSDIKINLNHRDKIVHRVKSAPMVSRTSSSHSCSSQTSIFESRMDYFRSRGAWRELVRYMGKWKKSTAGGPRFNMQLHSKNPRIAFSVSKADVVNEITPTGMQEKAHVLVSLLQDYRQGKMTINGMLASVGICLYKGRSMDRDEKKSLSKLALIDDVRSEGESREVTVRLDLEPGFYFLVPYTSEVGHTGEFLLRVLGEKDELAGKSACSIS